MSDEWDSLPFQSQMRLPITASIPYFYRWKILQLKLLLTDLKYLYEKHRIESAIYLYDAVRMEADKLCDQLREEMIRIINKREEITK